MSRARPRFLAPRSTSHFEVKDKNVVFTLCLSHNIYFCVPCHIAGNLGSNGTILVSLNFTYTVFDLIATLNCAPSFFFVLFF